MIPLSLGIRKISWISYGHDWLRSLYFCNLNFFLVSLYYTYPVYHIQSYTKFTRRLPDPCGHLDNIKRLI